MLTNTPHILVFYGSARPNASAPKVAAWLTTKLATVSEMTFEYIDVAALNLPLMNLSRAVAADEIPSLPALATWAHAVVNADGFIVIANEYNHAPSAIIKNAIDFLKTQWAHKPIAFVTYGGVMGGGRAAEHLRLVFAELEAVTVRDQMSIQHVYSQFDENGTLDETSVSGNLTKVLASLLWWALALKTARESSHVAPLLKRSRPLR